MNEIKKISEISIKVGRGRFDDHCVFVFEEGSHYAPRDIEYFNFFIHMSKKYSPEMIYSDFVEIYDLTTEEICENVLNVITEISLKYDENDDFDKWFTVIYLGMVAEERKQYAVLKKRIKRLGMHQIMIENQSANFAANYSRRKKAPFLINECINRGF